jgi:hypothetical protein
MSRATSHERTGRQDEENVSPQSYHKDRQSQHYESSGQATSGPSKQRVTHTAKSLLEQKYTPTESDYESIAMTLLGMAKDTPQGAKSSRGSKSKKPTYKQQQQSVRKLNDSAHHGQGAIWKRSANHQKQIQQALEKEKEMKREEEVRECTFRPSINENSSRLAKMARARKVCLLQA